MTTRSVRVLVFLLVGAALPAQERHATVASSSIDWPAFLARQDMVWHRLPMGWGESVFIGNGRVGATIDVEDGVLGWTINRTDVVHDASRFPVGRLYLKTAGAHRSGTARLRLWDAEASGTLVTDSGEVRWRSIVSREPGVIVIVLEGRGGERGVDLDWLPAEARPPRKIARKEAFAPEDLHPPATVSSSAAGITSLQTFIGGDAHAESIVRGERSGRASVFYVSIGYGKTGDAALAEARTATTAATHRGLEALSAAHRAWWHAYYPESFLTFPDARLESYYWIQIYKLGAAMRADGPILDLAGPWFRATPWPAIWWNLNIQLTYSPLVRANRMELAESLFRNLDRGLPALIDNVPERLRASAAAIGRSSGPDLVRKVDLASAQSDAAKEMGDLPWTMFYYWQFYRAQMDDRVLSDRVYPLLRRAIGNYLGYVERGADGHWHLPATHSPELATLPDANYDLTLLRWGLQTLIASAERLHNDEPLLPRWRDVFDNLTPFPTDSAGLMVGRDRPWKESHRHYSHLLAIYPLSLITPDSAAGRALIAKSLQTWEGQTSLFRGYSFTGGAAMHARLGEGDVALARLNQYLDAPRYMEANTFYAEAGPVIETPLSAAASIHELFLQDWGGVVRVFPAMPVAWKHASFDRLRADGAFLVSASRKDGRTNWVRITSLAGQPLTLRVADWDAAVVRQRSVAGVKVTRTPDGSFSIALPRGATVILAPNGSTALAELRPADRNDSTRQWPTLKPDSSSIAYQNRPDMAWWRTSMDSVNQRLTWWRDARFGMFIHWGAYSQLEGVWNGEPVRGYAEHIQRIRKIPDSTYRRQAVSQFNPMRFNADDWVNLARRAGMRYMIITAKHHDGFAMFDSKVSNYNIVQATPFKRDPLRELRDAAKRRGVRFGFYYSHAFDWEDPDAPGNDWERENPGGDRNLYGREWWVNHPRLLANARRYVDRKAIPQILELIKNYDPDIMWFDTPSKLPPEENLRILRAAREAKPTLVINGRAVQAVPGGPEARFGDYASTADRPAELMRHDGDWEAIPTTNESYGYHRMDLSHKPPGHFVQLLAKAAARGGNLLMNIGPMADGRFDPRDSTILDNIGAWMEVNAETIRGTQRTPLPVQTWGQSTRKGQRIYLHVFDWPSDGRLHVAGWKPGAEVTNAYLLAEPNADQLPVRRLGARDIEITVPKAPTDPWDSVIALDVTGALTPDSTIYLPATGAPIRLHVFDGRAAGGIRFGDGKRGRDVATGWNRVDNGIDWDVRTTEPARFRVALDYATATASDTGSFELTLGTQKLSGYVVPTPSDTLFTLRDVGEVTLPAGESTIAIRPAVTPPAELMRLRRLVLTPLPMSPARD